MAKQDKENKPKRKTKKRGNGEGSVFQRSDDQWVAKIQIGTKEDGKPIMKVFYGRKKQDVVDKLNTFKLTQSQGIDVTSVSFKEYIMVWLTVMKSGTIKEASYDRIESTINTHVIPTIGNYALKDLTPEIIKGEVINFMVEKELSYSMVKKAYNAINACCRYAVAKGQLIRNPAELVELPSQSVFEKTKIQIFTDEEIQKMEEVISRKFMNGKYIYRMGYGFVLMLYSGIRTAEALALQWKDVDFANKTLHIGKNVSMVKNRKKKNKDDATYVLKVQDSTKTEAGTRDIPISAKAMNALQILKEINYSGENGFVLCTENGDPIRPRNFRNTFDSILTNANVELKGMHSLRHTFASRLFRKGADVKEVSELLGHANVQITYDTYIHLIPQQKKDVISLLD